MNKNSSAPSPVFPSVGPETRKRLPRGTGCWKIGAGLLLAGWAALAAAETNRLQRLYVADKADRARLVFEFSAAPEYRLVRWAEPGRLLLEFADTRLAVGLRQPPASHPFVGRIEAIETTGQGLRVAIGLKRKLIHRAFLFRQGDRPQLAVELIEAGQGRAETAIAAEKPQVLHSRTTMKSSATRVVAIDAGHGGKDTGAIGPEGRLEKDIALSIARRLAGLIRAEPGLKPVLVRQDDRFIPLRARTAIARAAQADLFVSLHADADSSGQVRGMSVYTVSERGAGSEAVRWLARRDHAAVLAGGISLHDKDATLARVLFDLSQRATLADSERAASAILHEVRKRFPIHHHQVQRAGFVVLKSPDIPSVLVETGFISHPAGEKDLADPARQDQIARALFHGIRRYFASPARSRPVERVADAATRR